MTLPTGIPPEWLSFEATAPAVMLNIWDGAPGMMLIPITDGAILWWQFDEAADDSQYVLLAHLTDDEAERMYDAEAGAAGIEPIRSSLANDQLVVARLRPGMLAIEISWPLPKGMSEDAFIDGLGRLRNTLSAMDMTRERKRKGRKSARTGEEPERSPIDALASTVRVRVA